MFKKIKKSEEGAQLQDKADEVGSIDVRLSPEKPIMGAYEICETTLEDGYERKTYWSPSLTSFQFDVENISLKTAYSSASQFSGERSISADLQRRSERSETFGLFGESRPFDDCRLHIEVKEKLETPRSQMHASVAEEFDSNDNLKRRFSFCEFFWLLPTQIFEQVWTTVSEASKPNITFWAKHPAMHTEFHPNSDRDLPIKVLSKDQTVKDGHAGVEFRRADDFWENYETLIQNEFAEFSLVVDQIK